MRSRLGNVAGGGAIWIVGGKKKNGKEEEELDPTIGRNPCSNTKIKKGMLVVNKKGVWSVTREAVKKGMDDGQERGKTELVSSWLAEMKLKRPDPF